MTLHGLEHGDDVAWGYREAVKVIGPPLVEGFIWAYGEGLFRCGGLGKGVTDVCTKDKHIFGGGDSVEKTRTRLFDAVGIRLSEDANLAGAGRAVANAASFLSSVNGLDGVRPYEVKDGIAIGWRNWLTEHTLSVVLVELEEFGLPPVVPVVHLDKFASGEFHCFSHTVDDVTVRDKLKIGHLEEVCGHRIKIPMTVQLVVDLLMKRGRRNDW